MTRAAFLLLLVLAGCGQESAELQRRVDELRAERDKIANVAEHLDEYKEKIARIHEDEQRAKAMGLDLSHEERRAAAAKVPGATMTMGGAGAWVISGADSTTLDALFEAVPALHVQSVSVAMDGSWSVASPNWDPQGGVVEPLAGPEDPGPLPPPGRFPTPRARRLRAEVEALSREIAELRRLIGDTRQVEAHERRLKQMLALAADPTRLRGVRWLEKALFRDASAPCVALSVDVTPTAARFRCGPRNPDAEAAVREIRAALQSGAGERRLKIGSFALDPAHPLPVSGVLLPVSD